MNKGFTLIELLVVVLIIGILSAVALPQYQTLVERSRATEALTLMSAVRTALERFHAQHDEFPDDDAFNRLDVDLPCVEQGESGCAAFGGKYFTLSFTSDTTATVTATRNTGDYTLSTVITPQDSGAYTAVRSCTPDENSDDAEDYCNAISGGHPNDF